jgi:uncharacterized protein
MSQTSEEARRTGAAISYPEKIPAPTGYVNDYEGVFSFEDSLDLERVLDSIQRYTTIEVAVITLGERHVPRDAFDEFSFKIANQWGVGKAGVDNGIVLAISRSHRLVRIWNGKGISRKFSDEETKTVVDEVLLPAFREGYFHLGAKSAILYMVEVLSRRG